MASVSVSTDPNMCNICDKPCDRKVSICPKCSRDLMPYYINAKLPPIFTTSTLVIDTTSKKTDPLVVHLHP